MKLKKGDHVVVISGKDKGKEGEIIRAMPSVNKVIVSGVNTAKKHQKTCSPHCQISKKLFKDLIFQWLS
jgi:ribosomal protein L24